MNNEQADMALNLARATRKQLEDFLVDVGGFSNYELEDWSKEDMALAIFDYEVADKQGDQFAGYTY